MHSPRPNDLQQATSSLVFLRCHIQKHFGAFRNNTIFNMVFEMNISRITSAVQIQTEGEETRGFLGRYLGYCAPIHKVRSLSAQGG